MSGADSTAIILALAAVGKLGPVRIKAILSRANHPSEIPSWSFEQFRQIPGIAKEIAFHITKKLDVDYGTKLIDWAGKNDITILTVVDPDYPDSLRAIYDSPPVLFVSGKIIPEDSRAIAIVGSRSASDYGRITATKLAGELSLHSLTVVSGMALGIDSAAHRGALQAGGRTIAVLGSGIDIIYPYENKKLYRSISENGAVVSEFFPGTGPHPGNFPRRNRIISGLSQAVIVVEAGKKSGALLTADLALSQNKPLFAVPGNLSSKTSVGANDLIRTGAELLSSVEDIFSVLPELKNDYNELPRKVPDDLSEGEKLIIEHLSGTPIQLDHLTRTCGLSVCDAAAFLLSLELRGLVKQLSGKRFIAT